jgi:hypothetical protein
VGGISLPFRRRRFISKIIDAIIIETITAKGIIIPQCRPAAVSTAVSGVVVEGCSIVVPPPLLFPVGGVVVSSGGVVSVPVEPLFEDPPPVDELDTGQLLYVEAPYVPQLYASATYTIAGGAIKNIVASLQF